MLRSLLVVCLRDLSITFPFCSNAVSEEYGPVLVDFELICLYETKLDEQVDYTIHSFVLQLRVAALVVRVHALISLLLLGNNTIVTHVVHLRHSHQSSVRIRHSRVDASKRLSLSLTCTFLAPGSGKSLPDAGL